MPNDDMPHAARSRPAGRSARLSGRWLAIACAVIGLAIVAITDHVLPATSAHQAELRIWLASRAAGVVTLVLLAVQVLAGLLLSHPTNQTTWRLSKALFPWHETVSVFVAAFVACHVIALVADPYAGVGIGGALVPGLSSYRSPAVAVGTLAMYAFLITAVSARWTKLLPPGAWLSIHRLAIVVFGLSWVHGLLAGTDSVALLALYVGLACAVGGGAVYRYWVTRPGRVAPPLPEGSR